ncbi:sensor histidine kinase [Cohnella endophytica]|uniref:histidine kinase n=1 Tax=Cohnella endophytica TaxID=2419778 RepID=A0A494XHH2_9BACL|nr:histidine kinase [Cohnella endophytica]RKP48046.1 sensor histidine kinase [Cohnella endophytica]
MDFWMIGNKAGVFVYVVAVTFFLTPADDPSLHLLALLICLCLNMAIPIFKALPPKRILAVVSACFLIACAWKFDPIFLLFLPANLCELVLLSEKRSLFAGLAILAVLPFTPHGLIPAYVLVGFLGLLLFASGRAFLRKLNKLESEQEKAREDLERLTRSLNENKEYMRQSEYTIKLEERNRISQQIHDDIGHAMAGALIQMEASRMVLASNPDKASELLHNAISISKEGLERIRLTLKDAKPKSEELGIHRLRLMADKLSADRNMQATVAHTGDIDVISPLQWKIIQENAVEAITNSLKYGKATGIHMEIQVLNKFVKAVVSDNGVGAVKIAKGLGLVGMEERAASAGGTVIADGTKGGFSVTTLLPR